jgi:hypothetical protein
MTNLFSKSVEEKAIELILKGIDPIEAIKHALSEENNLISEVLAQDTERAVNVKNQMCKNTYALIHLKNAMA